MVPYYKEVENLDNFSLYLKNIYSNNKIRVRDVELPLSFYEKYKNLFKKVKVLDEMLKTVTFDLIKNHTYEEWQIIGSLSDTDYRDNLDYFGNSSFDIYNLIRVYRNVANNLQVIFPSYKEKLKYIEIEANEALKDIIKYTEIVLEDNQYVKYNWENAWYITPSNYLYNSGGKDGHKAGNFLYTFMELKEIAEKGKELNFYASNYYYTKAHKMFEQGYVSERDFLNYSNSTFRFINIETEETKQDELKEKEFLEYYDKYSEKKEEFMDYFKLRKEYFKDNEPCPIRSYQKNIITLVAGYYIAHADLENSLYVLNNSKHYNILKELLELCNYDINDFLVRFCSFSKIETTLPRTITTSRIKVYDDFKEYLERGWNIHLIPPIVYDKYKDTVEELSLDSYMVSKYLDKNENEYKNKVKIFKA